LRGNLAKNTNKEIRWTAASSEKRIALPYSVIFLGCRNSTAKMYTLTFMVEMDTQYFGPRSPLFLDVWRVTLAYVVYEILRLISFTNVHEFLMIFNGDGLHLLFLLVLWFCMYWSCIWTDSQSLQSGTLTLQGSIKDGRALLCALVRQKQDPANS